MKNPVLLALSFCLCLCAAADAETRDLPAANRSLLEESKAKHARLSAEQAEKPSWLRGREIEALAYKIKALEEDASRLENQPAIEPKPTDAKTFLKDLLLRAETAKKNVRRTSTSELHTKALEKVSQSDLSEAVRLYEEIILEDGSDDQAYLLMGHCLLMSGRYEKAELAFFRAVELNPANRDEIIPFYKNTVVKYPDDDTAYSDLGYAWLIFGEVLEAKQAFREALAINPENIPARTGLETIRDRETQ